LVPEARPGVNFCLDRPKALDSEGFWLDFQGGPDFGPAEWRGRKFFLGRPKAPGSDGRWLDRHDAPGFASRGLRCFELKSGRPDAAERESSKGRAGVDSLLPMALGLSGLKV
jgi:hypothetical protein